MAVFIDSAWWHGHPSRWTPGKLPGKWDDKISRNKTRDEQVTSRLTADGWTVLRFWDFEEIRETTLGLRGLCEERSCTYSGRWSTEKVSVVVAALGRARPLNDFGHRRS